MQNKADFVPLILLPFCLSNTSGSLNSYKIESILLSKSETVTTAFVYFYKAAGMKTS